MSTYDVNPYIFYIDTNERQIPIIEGSCEKYCIVENEKKQYCKYSKLSEVFAEVFTSQLLGQIGLPSVPYFFVIENDNGKTRIGTKSADYAEGVSYRASLDSMAEKTDMINAQDFTEHIYINLPKAMAVIEKFCKMHHIKLTEHDRQQIQTQLENQIVVDYCFCNSDHHLRNTEFLIYSVNGEKRICLAPMFDLGQCLRGIDVQMAFTFSDLSEEGKTLSDRGLTNVDMYAEHVLKYFKEKYSSPKELANDYAFRLLCHFQNINIDEEMFRFLCNCSDNYRHFRTNNLEYIKDENYYDMINLLVDEFRNDLGIKEGLSWGIMKDAFETRQRLIFEGLANDPFFREACNRVKPIHYNPPTGPSDSGKLYS